MLTLSTVLRDIVVLKMKFVKHRIVLRSKDMILHLIKHPIILENELTVSAVLTTATIHWS